MVLVVGINISILREKLVDFFRRHNNWQGHTFDETPLSITF